MSLRLALSFERGLESERFGLWLFHVWRSLLGFGFKLSSTTTAATIVS